MLPIQVIGQQWKWTYRYPTFGGFETADLVVPDHTAIAFHVTSLDVIHSFWAYQLGVKADANPGQDNVAYTTPDQLGSFVVRCDELCGLWHGAMYDYGESGDTCPIPVLGRGHRTPAAPPTPSSSLRSPGPTHPTRTVLTAGTTPTTWTPTALC